MARFRRRTDNGNKPLAEINVTPLVDVVLVAAAQRRGGR